MPETPIVATAKILHQLSPVTYQIALPNGKEVVGHLAKKLRDGSVVYAPGDAVRVEMTPYDFSKARIAERLLPQEKPRL